MTALTGDPASPADVDLEGWPLEDNSDSPGLGDWRGSVHQLQRNHSPCPCVSCIHHEQLQNLFSPLTLLSWDRTVWTYFLDLLKVLSLHRRWHPPSNQATRGAAWYRRERTWPRVRSLSSSPVAIWLWTNLFLSLGLHFFIYKTSVWVGRYTLPQPLCWAWLCPVEVVSPGVMEMYITSVRDRGPASPNSWHTLCTCLVCTGLGHVVAQIHLSAFLPPAWATHLLTLLLLCNLDFPAKHFPEPTFSLILPDFVCAPTTSAAWMWFCTVMCVGFLRYSPMCASCSQLSVKCYQSTVESPLYPAQCVEMCAAQSYAQFIEATDWKHIPEGFVELILRPFEFFS